MGYMGCGKSALGKTLAQSKSISYIDLDDYVESHEKTTISEIFQNKGELYFRKKERFYLEKLLAANSTSVIALGGGTPCYFDNIDFINQNSSAVTLYLKTSPKVLSERLFNQKEHRPMIAHLNSIEDLEQFIAKHLFERIPFYIKAQHHLSTDNMSLEDLAVHAEKLLA
jgi:shikimate kinase